MNNHNCQICQKPLTRNQSKFCSKKHRLHSTNKKRAGKIKEWAEKNEEHLEQYRVKYRKDNREIIKERNKKHYTQITENTPTKSLNCSICNKTFTTPHARASHERAGHNIKFGLQLKENCSKNHILQKQTNNALPQRKDYSSYQEYRKAYTKKYKELFPERKAESDKIYHTKYRAGELITPTIQKLMQNKEQIIKEYQQGKDSVELGKENGVNCMTILAFLRNQKIKINDKKYSCRKLICSNGLQVKSYAEKRIVELLLQKSIPFIYEKKITYNNRNYFPDFYFPEIETYVDYAGLIGIKDYDGRLEIKRIAIEETNKKYFIITKPEQILEVMI